MSTSSYCAFEAMFYALDAAYDENKNLALRSYLANANPFLFANEGSADPAVYETFKQGYDLALGLDASVEEARMFVREYLKGEGEALLESFDEIADAESWEKAILGLQH